MKILTLFFLISISCSVCAQKSTFVRVYNLEGKKINKGHVFAVTDSSLQLKGKGAPINIPVSMIGSIKTKRSAGHNLIAGPIIGASALTILGVATASPGSFLISTAGEGAETGALLGLAVGTAFSGLTILFKNSKTFIINGDSMKWKIFLSTTEKETNK